MARVIGIILCLAALTWFSPVQAEVPQQLHYKGYLTNAVGEAVDCPDPIQCGDGFDFTFRLYQSADSGDPIWEESLDAVAIYMGSFHVQLGNVNPINADIINGSLWLAVKVNDQGEMAPRQAITSAPFAVRAGHAEQAQVALNADQLGGVNATNYALTADLPTEDNDTLGDLACAAGMVPKATASGWVCDNDQTGSTDTTLSDEEVLNIVAGAGYVSGPHTVDTNTQLTEAEVDAYVSDNDFSTGAHTVDTDTLNELSCEAGQMTQWDGSAWTCAPVTAEGVITSSPKPCDAEAVGAMYFDAEENALKVCDGSEYRNIRLCSGLCPVPTAVGCGLPVEDDCGSSCGAAGTGLNLAQCPGAGTVACGQGLLDDCSNLCPGAGTALNTTQCSAASDIACGVAIIDSCANSCDLVGAGLNSTQCPEASSLLCGQPVQDDCANSCGATGTAFNTSQCVSASEAVCGAAITDDCANNCDLIGTGLNATQCPSSSIISCGQALQDNCGNACGGSGTGLNPDQCPTASGVACGQTLQDDCSNSCGGAGTALNPGQCPAASSVLCGQDLQDDCANSCGTGTALNTSQCGDVGTTACGLPIVDNCGNSCGTGTQCAAGICIGTSCADVVCNGGSPIAASPDNKIVMCQNGSSCEQNKGDDCPTNFHLCNHLEWNHYNDGWSASFGTAVGAIYCRGGGGAGHFTISGGSDDESFNCGHGSSNPWCSTGYGCNEQADIAACCIDNPSCGDGLLDSTIEQCDDGNTSDGDGCDSDCKVTNPGC